MQWLARGEHGLPGHLDWLTGPERARLDLLRFTKRRTEYLLRRWTAKQAVSTALAWPRQDDDTHLARILVGNHPTGAPYVEVDGEPLDGDISVSDRAGWAVCLVGSRGAGDRLDAVGIDLEIVEPRSDGFVSDFLTGPERDYVRSQPGRTAQDAAANLFWSAKESALKVLRTGLRADTRTVEVTVSEAIRPDGWASLEVRHTPTGRRFPGWWRCDGVFVLTMAAELPLPSPPVVLPGSDDLTGATPTHSWLTDPVAW
ncbi:MAG: 4'-phosphopantetheinyl transferase superfamily protein [Kineosporiaceae bacterium]